MKKTLLGLAVLTGLGIQPGIAAAAAALAPSIRASVNGDAIDIGLTQDQNAPNKYDFNVVNSSYEIHGSLVAIFDPQLSYSIGLTNLLSSTTTFAFIFSMPYVGGPYGNAYSSHSGSFTDGGNGSVTISPPSAYIHQPLLDGTPFGPIVGGCSFSGGAFTSGPCGAGTILGIPILSLASGTLEIDVAANVSGNDLYSLNGLAGIDDEPVPEPLTLAIFGMGLAGAVVLRRRRGRAA